MQFITFEKYKNYYYIILEFIKGAVMAYFPMFVRLENKKVLIIGGGKIANRKLIKLSEYTKNIKIITSKCIDLIQKNAKSFNFELSIKEYDKDDLKGFDIVVVAVDNIKLQKQIYNDTREQNILFNCSDIEELNDFIFPSIINDGDLSIAISTNGVSPSFAKRFKKYVIDIIPKDVGILLNKMKELRDSLPKGEKRMEEFNKKVDEYFKSRFDN